MAHYHYVNYRSNRGTNSQRTEAGVVCNSKVPFRFSVNPGQLQEITLGTHLECAEGGVGGIPLLYRQSSLDHVSPIRGRTMKEYDQQIVELKNENFNLKLRIYFLEERLQHKFSDSSDDIHKSNIELKIEVESLKKELSDKQELLMKASSALETMEGTHKNEMDEMQAQFRAQQRSLEEQIFRLQQAVDSFQQKSSCERNGDESKREEFYQQAFAPFPSSSDSAEECVASEWQLKIKDLDDELSRVKQDLNSKESKIQQLEKNVAEKENFIREEEINNVKRHKFIQGLVTAVKNKEKQLSQLQEQFDLQALELKSVKERLNLFLKKEGEERITTRPESQNQQQSLEKLNEEKESLEASWLDALKKKDEAILDIQSKMDAERQMSIDQISSIQNQLQLMQNEFKEKLENKEEIIFQLQKAVDDRNSILQNCLQMIGALKSGEKITDSSVYKITDLFKTTLMEKENKTKKLMEERIKLLKEKDNELIRSEEKETEEIIRELKSTLDNRDCEIKELHSVIQSLKEDRKETNKINNANEQTVVPKLNNDAESKTNENMLLQGKFDNQNDFIVRLKKCVEAILDENNTCKVDGERDWSTVSRILGDSGLLCSETTILEQILREVEERVKTNAAKNTLLDTQIKSVNKKMLTIRKLIYGIQDGESNEKNDVENDKSLEENLQVVFQGVKMMMNLNDLFRQQIQLNNDAYLSSDILKKRHSFNLATILDKAVENHQIKTHHISIPDENDKRFSNVVFKRGSGCEEVEPMNNLIQLHDAHVKIENLKQKLSSTENTVHLLGTKIKHYRKLLQDCGQIPPSPISTTDDSPLKSNYNEPNMTNIEEKIQITNNDARRSVSADDLRVLQGVNNSLVDDNQALSAEDVLATPFKANERPADVALRNHCTKLLLSPYTPDSLVDYGQTGDVLELKEQVCRLKLLLEEKEGQIGELYSEREAFRASTTHHMSQLTSLLKEQTLTPSEHNFSIYNKQEMSRAADCLDNSRLIRSSEAQCQVGDGIIGKVDQHQFENTDEELQWLQNLNAMLHSQLEVLINEIPDGRYSAYIQLQQQDISVLKNRLLDSHDACELLRIRLEELAEFLEQLLRFDENGFLDVSQFTPQKVESLKRRIAESRELSHSLSHSLLVDVADTSNVTSCPDGHESLQHYSVKDDTGDRNKSLKKMRSQSWMLQEQIRMHDVDSGMWNNDSRLTTPEFDGMRTLRSSSALENVTAAEKELDGTQLSRNRNYHRELLLDCVDSPKMNQSSCDDLILLLNPDQKQQQQQQQKQQQHQSNSKIEMYARDEPSGDTNSQSQSQNSISNNDNDVRALDSLREQAIMEEYVRHYTSRQFADDNDKRSSYHRTNHALSFSHHKEHEKSSCQRPRGVISPSDSESWSEPDRDVSQQRIGLELEEKSFNIVRERVHFGRSPKSLKMKNQSSSNAGSTTDQSHAYFSKSTNSPKSGRGGEKEMTNVDIVQRRLSNLEELNNALKSELKIYQTLHEKSTNQSPSTREFKYYTPLKNSTNQSSINRASSTGIGTTDSTTDSKTNDGIKSSTEKKKQSNGDKMRLILNEHLLEIRTLRLRLEESIRINDKLNMKLEKRLVSRQLNGDEIDHLAMELSEKECALAELKGQLQIHWQKENDLHVESQELYQHIRDLTEKLELANSHVVQLEKEIISRTEGSQKLKQANQGLQNSIAHLQTAFADKERVVKELRDANLRMQRTLETVDNLMTQQANELSEAYQEKEKIKTELETVLNKHKNQVIELTRVVQETRSQFQEKAKADEARVKEMTQTHEKQLKAVVIKLDEKNKAIAELENVVGELKKELETKKDECEKVKVKFEELKVAVTRTEKQLEDEHGLCLSQQQKINELMKSLNEKENNLLIVGEKVVDLESMLNRAEKEFIEQRDKADGLVIIVSERDKKIEQLEKIIEKMQQVISEKKKTLERQLETAKCLEMKVQQLNCTANQKEQKCLEEQNTITKLHETISNLEKEVKEEKENVSMWKIRLQKQELVYQELQVKLDERGTSIRKLEDELRSVKEDNEKLQHQVLTTNASFLETSELNKSLKTELNIYEHLHKNISSKKAVSGLSPNSSSNSPVDLRQLLNEMRHLRSQLELSIQTNNALRGQLGEHFLVKLGSPADGEKVSDALESDDAKTNSLHWNSFQATKETNGLPVKKCASLPTGRCEPMVESEGKNNTLRRQSKSSDCLTQEFKRVQEKTELAEIKLNRNKKEGITKLNLGKLEIGDGSPLDRSPSGQLDSHCIYSSPDLGIESDPSHFSSLERKMSDITEEHLWDIRSGKNQHKNAKKSSPLSNSNTNRKIKHGYTMDGNDQLVCVIGCLSDYDLLKKELESGMTVMKGLQTRVKERMQFCCKNSSIKNLEYTTLKEIQCKCNVLNTSLGKSLKVIGCFWTALLPSQTISQSKDTKNPKLLQENLLLKKKLHQQKSNLEDALTKLAASSRLKEGMEKAIMKQLSKTHDVLKRAKGNLEDQAVHPKMDK